MPTYLVHFVKTQSYDVPVEAESAAAAEEKARAVVGPEHADPSSVAMILALADEPVEMVSHTP